MPFTTRFLTLAGQKRISGSATWLRLLLTPSLDAASNMPPMVGRTSAATALTATRSGGLCQTSARNGAQELYDSYRAAGLTAAEIESGRYTRLSRLRHLLTTGAVDSSLRRSQQEAVVA